MHIHILTYPNKRGVAAVKIGLPTTSLFPFLIRLLLYFSGSCACVFKTSWTWQVSGSYLFLRLLQMCLVTSGIWQLVKFRLSKHDRFHLTCFAHAHTHRPIVNYPPGPHALAKQVTRKHTLGHTLHQHMQYQHTLNQHLLPQHTLQIWSTCFGASGRGRGPRVWKCNVGWWS